MKKLAIVTTHPIQYNAPLFRKLAENGKVQLLVFYTWGRDSVDKHDPGFGKQISWDVPLLEGYPYTFMKNSSPDPGSHHFKGIICPTLTAEIARFAPDAILVYGWNFHAHRRVMHYFKGKIPIWFRGDSTLLDYDYQTFQDLLQVYFPRFFNPPFPHPASKIANHQSSIKNPLFPLFSYFKFLFRKRYLTQVYKDIDKALYVGTHNKAYYLAHGIKETQLVYMPHAVDNHFFGSNHETREKEALEWRRSLGIGDSDFTLVFAGKFEPRKNPELLVRAIIELNEANENKDSNAQRTDKKNVRENSSSPYIKERYHLIMVGNGILEKNLNEMALNKSFIHFLPFQNQSRMPVVYRLGAVFCLSSQSETWGLAVNEALACQRKVLVTTKVGCAPDLIIPGKTGEIVRSGSIEDLKDAIQKLYSSGSIDTLIFKSMITQFSIDNQASVAETLLN